MAKAARSETGGDASWNPIRDLVSATSEDEFTRILRALDQRVTRQAVLRELLRNAVPPKFRARVPDVLAASVGYLAAWMTAGMPGDIDQRVADRAFPDQSDIKSRGRVTQLMSAMGLRMTAGALSAQRGRGLNVLGVSLSMDLTPARWPGDPGSLLIPAFQLSIDRFDQFDVSKESRQSIVLDIQDLRALKSEIESVLEDVEGLASVYANNGVVIWDAVEVDD